MRTSDPNFLDLEPERSDPDASGILILPLPLDLTASWKRGTDAGPAAIIEASSHIELYDDELGFDTAAEAGGVATLRAPALPTDPKAAAEAIELLAAGLIQEGRLLISLGGEHSVTFPLVSAHRRVWPDLCVLQIDAHADLRDTYHGSPYNHACPMRRLLEMGVHVTAVGIRSVDASEAPLLDGELRRTFSAHLTAGKLDGVIEEIIESLPGDNLYISVDLDGLDPAVVPAVGTPVPGGLGWHETLSLLRALFKARQVIGADVVELSPREGLHCADSAAARLVYKAIGYWAEHRG
jgi:agmatinase